MLDRGIRAVWAYQDPYVLVYPRFSAPSLSLSPVCVAVLGPRCLSLPLLLPLCRFALPAFAFALPPLLPLSIMIGILRSSHDDRLASPGGPALAVAVVMVMMMNIII